jgi:hypothetical protein
MRAIRAINQGYAQRVLSRYPVFGCWLVGESDTGLVEDDVQVGAQEKCVSRVFDRAW